MNIFDFSSSEGQLGAQVCFNEGFKLRKKDLEGPSASEERKKIARSRQESSQKLPKSQKVAI